MESVKTTEWCGKREDSLIWHHSTLNSLTTSEMGVIGTGMRWIHPLRYGKRENHWVSWETRGFSYLAPLPRQFVDNKWNEHDLPWKCVNCTNNSVASVYFQGNVCGSCVLTWPRDVPTWTELNLTWPRYVPFLTFFEGPWDGAGNSLVFTSIVGEYENYSKNEKCGKDVGEWDFGCSDSQVSPISHEFIVRERICDSEGDSANVFHYMLGGKLSL